MYVKDEGVDGGGLCVLVAVMDGEYRVTSDGGKDRSNCNVGEDGGRTGWE